MKERIDLKDTNMKGKNTVNKEEKEERKGGRRKKEEKRWKGRKKEGK